MTKGLTGLASHNSNMVAPHEQNYEGGWTIYCTKNPEEQRNSQKGIHNPFLIMIRKTPVIIISFQLPLLPAVPRPVPKHRTKASYAEVVKRTGHKSQPPMKLKTETSDEESICSKITQDSFLLKCTKSVITDPSEHQGDSVLNKSKKHNDKTRNSNKARATRSDVKKTQKNEFPD